MYKGVLIFIIFLILDLIYINFSQSFYEYHMNIKYSNVKVIPAILAWICVAVSYYYSVQEPFDNKYLRGLILSVGMYGVYNFTNLAVLDDYSYELTIRDITWGTTLISLVTLIYSYIVKY
jgi:uncharacterized membrane protein